ncbi:Ig-like domain-containing protein [Candidatus Peregrinibacteria bacterium]|nr:Ig-like domain-containing protein [Candidatus Peregrinibacteria bacterium]
MDKNKFTNRPVDKIKLNKSKEYLWKYLSKKIEMKKQHAVQSVEDDRGPVDGKATFGDFFKSLFRMPERLASMGVIAGLLIIALVFSSTLRGWFGAKIEVVHANFEMVAEKEDASGVAGNSGFNLTATEDVSLDTVKEYLKVQPEVKLDIEKTGKGKYEVKPVKGLEGNKIYNFSIQTDHGDLSWAYQIQDVFKVDGTLPANQATSVPLNSGIEINFSHDNYDFDHIKDYFEITPKVEGKFQKHERILAFGPKFDELKAGTIYTVKVKKGFAVNGSDKKLTGDFVFKFETANSAAYQQHFTFQRQYYEITSNSAVALDMSAYNFEQMNKKDVQIQVYKYKDENQYVKEIKNSMQVPQWAYYSRNSYLHPLEGLQDLGSFKGLIEKPSSWHSYVYLPGEAFENGHYLLQVDDAGIKSQALLQITDLSAYANVSLSDSVLWVNDLKTGKPALNATVEIGDIKEQTGSDGVARFKTPEKWLKHRSKGENEIEDVVKIKALDGKILIMPLDSAVYFAANAGDHYWKSLLTDRPKYKPTDTVSFWGFLKPKSGVAKPDNLKMKLILDWDTFVADVPLEISDDTLQGKIDLKSVSPGYYYLNLYQNDELISSTGIEVEDYVKPAYNLTMEVDKHAVFAGETMNFKIKSAFFDGTPVANLDLNASNDQKIRTDLKGEAKVSKVAEKSPCSDYEEYCSDQDSFYYQIESKLSEETSIQAANSVQIFGSHLNIGSKAQTNKKADGSYVAALAIKTDWIDLGKINGDTPDYENYVGETAKNRKFTGKIVESHWEKVETGEYYNFQTKLTEKSYDYKEVKKDLGLINGSTDANGEASYEFAINPNKYYTIMLQSPDDQGNMAHHNQTVYGDMSKSSGYDYYNVKVLNNNQNDHGTNYKFEIGETVNTAIANGDVALSKDTKGSFLFMQEVNGIQKYAVKDSPYYSFDFAKDDVPNIYVEGVWFDGKSYKVAYNASVYYKTDLKKLKIKIAADRGDYKPGDEASLTVNVADQSGNPVRAKVNFNIVDEAYYKAVYNGVADPLDDIYAYSDRGILTSYYSHDNPLNSAGDSGGKGGCFTGETQILMADGTTKAIKDIQKGDKILTKADEFSAKLIPAEVTGKMVKYVGEYLLINDNLEVTAEHIVFANGKWERVANLKIGDRLVNKDGKMTEIASISRVVRPVDVYNIEIKDYHTYFANGFFVHNEKSDGDYYVRQQFKDTAFFYMVDTGVDGRGSVKFKLPDNITSWRVMARAIDPDGLQAGTESQDIKVTLPFFADIILNREYSVKDKPMIKVRAYGKDLKDGDDVSFKPEVDGLAEKVISGKAFVGSYFNLPALPIGTHDVTVKADFGNLKDALKKPFEVKGSRLKQDVVKIVRNIDDKSVFELGKQGPTQIEFLDGGVAYYYYNLLELAYDDGNRLDQVVARKAAREILNKYFGKNLQSQEDENGNYIVKSYQRQGGLSLLPYSSQDLRLSALVMAFDLNQDRYSKQALRDYFYGVFKNSKSNLDDVVLALLGLAGMKEPVLLDLREIMKAEELSVQQKLYLGLAFAKIGSDTDARAILKSVVEKLPSDTSYQGVQNMALAAALAADINDTATSESLWKNVEDIGFKDQDLVNLYELGYVANSIKNAKKEPVKFTYKLNKHEESVELEPCGCKGMMAFPGDEVAVSVSKGAVAAVLNYEDSVEPGQFKKDPKLTIGRQYFVNGNETTKFGEGDIVKVVLTVNNPGKIQMPFYRIRDILPSGLTPATGYVPFHYYGGNTTISYPFMINGQEVNFVWFPFFEEVVKGTSQSKISYYAKVVNPGDFYADPARIEAFYDQKVANISDSAMVKIKVAEK